MAAIRFLALILLALALSSSGCVRSDPWRTGGFGENVDDQPNIHDYTLASVLTEDGVEPPQSAKRALVERFFDDEQRQMFEIGYLEFSERGNVFDARRAQFVKQRIADYAKKEQGVITVVFVHGWNNNASANNDDVRSFRHSLAMFTQKNQATIDGRQVVGLYIGWRGGVTNIPGARLFTFWDRKSVAEEIGKGGFTDLVLDLEQYDALKPRRNILVVVGHSFGAALLLSAYSELVLQRVKLLAEYGSLPPQIPVADLLFLVNPAIQANELFAVKEAVVKHQPWPAHTPSLMTVMSSRADWLTHSAFAIGQFFGTLLPWRQQQLCRPGIATCEAGASDSRYLHENSLDTMTVGNYPPFHTLELIRDGDAAQNNWSFRDLCAGADRLLLPRRHADAPVFPCSASDPVQFIYTSKDFIRSHSDVFNDQVRAYLMSAIKTRLSRAAGSMPMTEQRQVNALYKEVYRGILHNKQ